MAYQRDILETVFLITGGAQYIATTAQGALSTGTLAAADAALNASLEVTAGLLSLINVEVLVVTGAMAALAAALGLVTAGLAAFADESKRLFETGVILKNIGSSLTLPQVQQFAQQTSVATGLSRPQIEGTAGLLARTGVGGAQIASLLKTIADTARATGKSFDEVGIAVEKGILGHTRGLYQFGLAIQDTGSKAANLALIQQQLNIRFEGAAVAFRQTLPGAIDAFQSSLQRFFSALGEKFAPAAIKALNTIIAVVDFLTDHIEAFADTVAFVLGGPIGLLLLKLSQLGSGKDNPMAQVGHGGDPATEATALQIADNTARMADAVEVQVLGGSGEVVRQQFGFLHARLAMNI